MLVGPRTAGSLRSFIRTEFQGDFWIHQRHPAVREYHLAIIQAASSMQRSAMTLPTSAAM